MKDLQEIFDAMPNDTYAEVFDNVNHVGFSLCWSEKGRGFGEYSFFVDKKNGKFSIDNENDRIETVKRMLDKFVDASPGEVKKLFHAMVDHGYPEEEKENAVDDSITLNGVPINKEDY